MLAVHSGDPSILFASAEVHCAVVVLFGDPVIAMIENRAGKMRILGAVDRGSRGGRCPE